MRNGNGREMADKFRLKIRLPHNFQRSLTCRKSVTWDWRLDFPSKGRHAEDFFAQKNLTASAGFEPMILGTRGQHITGIVTDRGKLEYLYKNLYFYSSHTLHELPLQRTQHSRYWNNIFKWPSYLTACSKPSKVLTVQLCSK